MSDVIQYISPKSNINGVGGNLMNPTHLYITFNINRLKAVGK